MHQKSADCHYKRQRYVYSKKARKEREKLGLSVPAEPEISRPQSARKKKGIKATAIHPVGKKLLILIDLPQELLGNKKNLPRCMEMEVEVISAPQKGDLKPEYTLKILDLRPIFSNDKFDPKRFVGQTFISRKKIYVRKQL